ncbi:MAG: NAD(P)H-dependent oxidoreductase subunit E [Gammaproteobacteria bacterium]|nr:NAD(P)H-dependent oxidoreductase subunit E [Gammaproteobacteria bacterium]
MSSSDLGNFISRVTDQYSRDPLQLINVLREVQDRYSHVPSEAMPPVAAALGVSLGRVQGVVEYYSFFHTSPRGQYEILLSDSITDHMLGKQPLMDYLCERLGVSVGETRADGRVSVGNASCTGMCDQGPAGLVNGYTVTRLTKERVDEMVELIDAGKPLSEWPAAYFQVEDNIRREDALLGTALEDGAALRAVLDRGEEAVLGEIVRSGLRGLGGAGFKTGIKWSLCRETHSTERYVVCNADEGEPGTFKDRVLLNRDADRVFEGMTLCARVIGAQRGYLYLRSEYRYMLEALETVLQRRRAAELLGENILGVPGFSFDIEIHLGAGAYMCGEESALIESLEGKRGVARVRPPFPVTHGFVNKPTVVNNVETFLCAALIAERGGDWFAAMGTEQSKGTKLLSVSGDCARPGIYEYPFGVTMRQVLVDCGADNALAVQVAGAAGHCFPESEFDRRIAYEDVATGGSFMVFNRDRDMLDMARNFAHFFAYESCGFCTPCRVGTSLMKNLMDKVYAGHGTEADLEEMRNLGSVMQETSQCGLGSTAPNAILDTLDKFSDVYQRRLKSTAFEPAFDLDGALEEARQLTGREDSAAHL